MLKRLTALLLAALMLLLTAAAEEERPAVIDRINAPEVQADFAFAQDAALLDDMMDAVGIDRDKLCTYCWDGRE